MKNWFDKDIEFIYTVLSYDKTAMFGFLITFDKSLITISIDFYHRALILTVGIV